MLIVYQSLESTGTKDDTAGTVLGGNSFKHRTQSNAGKVYKFGSKRTITYPHPYFDSAKKEILYEDRKIAFADGGESKALSNQFKKKKDKAELLTFLEGVIDTIKKSTMNRAKASTGMFSTRIPDIIVLGEMYGGDIKARTIAGYEVLYGMNPTGDARHRFTVLKNTHSIIDPLDIKIHSYDLTSKDNKNENAICMMMEIMGWLMAFVHTPNAICGDGSRAAKYVKNNVKRSTGGTELDLLIGDTNQPNSEHVKKYMQKNFGTGNKEWVTSIHARKQEVVGFGGHQTFCVSGTNSGFDTHFDIACTHHEAAVIQGGEVVGSDTTDEHWEPVFVFHGLTDKFTRINDKAYAYSDHNGIIVEVLRRKDAMAYKALKRKETIEALKLAQQKQIEEFQQAQLQEQAAIIKNARSGRSEREETRLKKRKRDEFIAGSEDGKDSLAKYAPDSKQMRKNSP